MKTDGVLRVVVSALICSLALSRPFAQSTPQTSPPTWEDWVAGVRTEALAKGISAATVDQAFAEVKPDPGVIQRDRAQPEVTQTLDDYVAARLSEKNVTTAKTKAAEHRALIVQIRDAYGIPGPVMVAIWGLESNFGQFTGVRPVITALATLAYDTRRPALFRGELFQALTILDRGLARPQDFIGSWAGAIGQPQFMPSSFLKYAVDFDGDGKIDIWKSPADVLASMASYLKTAGWNASEPWGREVAISTEVMTDIGKKVTMRTMGCRALRQMTDSRPLSDWRELGVTLPGGASLPETAERASLVKGKARHFLVSRNYHALLEYNCSNSYAVAAGLMADKLK